MESHKSSSLFVILISYIFTLSPLPAAQAEQTDSSVIYQPTWQSIDSRPIPQWFSDAKFGIFIHWGLYSVPAWGQKGSYAEWYLNGLRNSNSRTAQFHKKMYGQDSGYEVFAPMFKAELFDPDQWADIFQRSGARYVILTSKHHDGFCLWPSAHRTGWNSADAGPKRDLIGDLFKAIRKKQNIKAGLYYSLMEWKHPLYPDQIEQYVDDYMIPQIKDLVDRYEPSIIWGDGEWDQSAETWKSKELLAYLFNEAPNRDELVVNDRWGGGIRYHHGGYYTSEYGTGFYDAVRPWEETQGMGASFGFNRNETIDEYKSADEVIELLVDIVSRGGNLLLNIGPTADGRIPVIMQDRLVRIGDWLKVNSPAIYNTTQWQKTGEYETARLKRVDEKIDFEWGQGSPDKTIKPNGFNVVWTGFIQPNFSEEYTFHTKSDDGIRLWIDGKKVIENWTIHDPSIEDSGQIKLMADKKYPIKIEYFEKDGGAALKLFWSGKSQPKQIVPQKCLYTAKDLKAGDGLMGNYDCIAGWRIAYTKADDAVYAFIKSWPKKSILELDISKPSDNTVVTMVGREGSLPWTLKNNKMYIDLASITIDELPCDYVWTFKLTGNVKP